MCTDMCLNMCAGVFANVRLKHVPRHQYDIAMRAVICSVTTQGHNYMAWLIVMALYGYGQPKIIGPAYSHGSA